jgi:hypothetical protein
MKYLKKIIDDVVVIVFSLKVIRLFLEHVFYDFIDSF